MKPRLYRWRFNLKTGAVSEGPLDDRILEFGSFNQQVAGEKGRYLYSTTARPGWFLFTGVVKHDLETGRSWTLSFGDNRYGSEAPFAPRVGARDEDDGYLVSFITDMNANRSECVVIDAKDIEAGPVCGSSCRTGSRRAPTRPGRAASACGRGAPRFATPSAMADGSAPGAALFRPAAAGCWRDGARPHRGACDHQQPIGQGLRQAADERDRRQGRQHRAQGNDPGNSQDNAKGCRRAQADGPGHRQQHAQPRRGGLAAREIQPDRTAVPEHAARPARQTAQGAQVCRSSAAGGVTDGRA